MEGHLFPHSGSEHTSPASPFLSRSGSHCKPLVASQPPPLWPRPVSQAAASPGVSAGNCLEFRAASRWPGQMSSLLWPHVSGDVSSVGSVPNHVDFLNQSTSPQAGSVGHAREPELSGCLNRGICTPRPACCAASLRLTLSPA